MDPPQIILDYAPDPIVFQMPIENNWQNNSVPTQMDPQLTQNNVFNLHLFLSLCQGKCQKNPVSIENIMEQMEDYSIAGTAKIDKSIQNFAQKHYPHSELHIEFVLPGETKGISGAPVYRVFRLRNAKPKKFIAVAKAFPKQEEFLSELRAISVLSKLSLQKSYHVQVLRVGKCKMLDGGSEKELPLLLQSAAEGEGLDEHLKKFFLSKSDKEEIEKIISCTAKAFAELHKNTKSENKANFQKYVVAIQDMVNKCNTLYPELRQKLETIIKTINTNTGPNEVKRELPSLLQSTAESGDLNQHLKKSSIPKSHKREEIKNVISCSAKDFTELHKNTKSNNTADSQKYLAITEDMVNKCSTLYPGLRQKIELLIKVANNNAAPNGTLIHGDSHPGNIFADKSSCKITLIDVSSLASSVLFPSLPSLTNGNTFEGNAPPERDFSNFIIRVRDIYVRCLVEGEIDSDEQFAKFDFVHKIFSSQYDYPLTKPQEDLQYVRSLLGTICRCQENINKTSLTIDLFLKEMRVQRLALSFLENIMNRYN